MRYEESIQYCFDNYPILFPGRWQVLNQFFCVIGNGYKWENGELVAKEYPGEEKREEPTLPPDGRAYHHPRTIRLKLMAWYEEIYKKLDDYIPNPEDRIIKEGRFSGEERMLPNVSPKTEKIIIQKVEEHIKTGNEEHINFYPLSESSAIFTYPEDIKPDWLEGIKEVVRLLLIHGHGGPVQEMNDWQKDQKIIYTNELIKLANKLDIPTINLNK